LDFDIESLRSSVSRKSGVIGDDRYINLFCELNEASKV